MYSPTSKLLARSALVLCLATTGANLVFAQQTSAQADERLAMEYLYCSELSGFMSHYIGRTEGDTPERRGYARAREEFRLEALEVSNDDFVRARQREVIEQVGREVGTEEGLPLALKKFADCGVLYRWMRKGAESTRSK